MPRRKPTQWLDDAAARAGAFELELTRTRRTPRTRRFTATVGAAALLCAGVALSAGAATLVPDPDQPPAETTTTEAAATAEAPATTTETATTTDVVTTTAAPEEAPLPETTTATATASTTTAATTTEAAPAPPPPPAAPVPAEAPNDDAIAPVPAPAGTVTEAAPPAPEPKLAPNPGPPPRPARRPAVRHVQVPPVLPPAPAPAPRVVPPPAPFDVEAWESDHPGSSVGATAAWIAQQYVGTPYVWGGATPADGFDCSGLVLYVYGRLGVSLPHYAAAQYALFPHLQPSELRPGDLVFFEPKVDGPGHVAIYLGGDRIVEAPFTGADVRIGSLSGSAAALGFVGAVRPYRTLAASAARVTVGRSLREAPLRLLSGRTLQPV